MGLASCRPGEKLLFGLPSCCWAPLCGLAAGLQHRVGRVASMLPAPQLPANPTLCVSKCVTLCQTAHPPAFCRWWLLTAGECGHVGEWPKMLLRCIHRFCLLRQHQPAQQLRNLPPCTTCMCSYIDQDGKSPSTPAFVETCAGLCGPSTRCLVAFERRAPEASGPAGLSVSDCAALLPALLHVAVEAWLARRLSGCNMACVLPTNTQPKLAACPPAAPSLAGAGMLDRGG